MDFIVLDAIIGAAFIVIVCAGFSLAWWVEQRRIASYEWEVFNPMTGRVLLAVESEAIALRLTSEYPGTDYARKGEGWV